MANRKKNNILYHITHVIYIHSHELGEVQINNHSAVDRIQAEEPLLAEVTRQPLKALIVFFSESLKGRREEEQRQEPLQCSTV